jgi:hypothetical protein
MSENVPTIDDILGPNVDSAVPNNIVKLNGKYSKNIDKLLGGGNISIDNILNNGLINFDNKHQTSMFFVTYKSLDTIYKELHNKYNFTIPKELVEKAVNVIIPNMIKEYTGNMKKRCKKVINQDMICLGRKLDNKQCSRKKHNGTDFCKSHLRKLSNGRIDQPYVSVNKNKRGRKRKVQFDPRQYDNEYITLWEDIVDGHKVLVDNNNNVYTFNLTNPVFLGKKDISLKLDLTKIKESAPESKISFTNPDIQDNQNNQDNQEHVNDTKIITHLDINIEDNIKNLVINEDNNQEDNQENNQENKKHNNQEAVNLEAVNLEVKIEKDTTETKQSKPSKKSIKKNNKRNE